jgi:asparagine synthase (glutamine-hydrolysing)
MSVIFGVRKPVGQIIPRQEILQLATGTERYAPDGTFVYALGRIGMGFQPLHTTGRSRLESQPTVDSYDNVVVFDGRLDNHNDLAHSLNIDDKGVSDSSLVLAAFAHWGENCFSQLVGDWALALWSGTGRVLYLARDHAGTRTLFLQNANGTLRWSTYLETFFTEGIRQPIDEEFAAAFLSSLPIRELTPYQGIRAVPPAHYLVVQNDKITKKPHWQWMAEGDIRYKSDAQYEEHFLTLFRQSVARRAGPDTPILAELSGGMDSTSIVCMSDHIRRSAAPSAELVDTISFYDDSEPSWDEKPYFSTTEAKRGKVGIHVETSFTDITFVPPDSSLGPGLHIWPGLDNRSLEQERKIQQYTGHRDYRVILSGIGGDELLGGVPAPAPELADYLISANLGQLLRRSTEWCIASRTPLLHALYETVVFAAGLYWPSIVNGRVMPSWIKPRLRRICLDIERRDVARDRRFGARPSVVSNGRTWWSIMETLPHLVPGVLARPEYRFPYLDRDLVDFLFRIPREQLVRPGRRRSLMRRALREIVPIEVLERTRKGYIARGPLVAIQNARDTIQTLLAHPLAAEYGLIDPVELRPSVDLITSGKEMKQWPILLKAIAFELWLRANTGNLALGQTGLTQVHARVSSGQTRSAQVGPRD